MNPGVYYCTDTVVNQAGTVKSALADADRAAPVQPRQVGFRSQVRQGGPVAPAARQPQPGLRVLRTLRLELEEIGDPVGEQRPSLPFAAQRTRLDRIGWHQALVREQQRGFR